VPKLRDNFRRNSFACGNPSLLAPYFRLFQWYLSAPYTSAPRADARLARNLVRSCSEANKSNLAQKIRQIYGIRHFIISFLRPVTVAVPNQICLVHKVLFCCFNFHVIFSSSLYPACFGRSPFRLFVCPIQIIPVSAAVAVLVYALSELLTSDYLYCAGTHCPCHYVILKEETRLVLSFVSFNAQIWEGEVKPLGHPALIDTQIEIFTWVLLGLCSDSIPIRTHH
jgi:hypothetical protein